MTHSQINDSSTRFNRKCSHMPLLQDTVSFYRVLLQKRPINYMTHSQMHDSFIWLNHQWMRHSCVREAWLIHMCDVTHACVWRDTWMCVRWHVLYVCHDAFIRVTWHICMCDVTQSFVWRDSFIYETFICAVTHSYVWRDAFMCATTHSNVCCGTCICVPWHVLMCTMTRSYVWHTSTNHHSCICYNWVIYILGLFCKRTL